MKITADFKRITGRIKPMHGVGQPPFYGSNFSMFKYLTGAHIPYSRLHDVGGWLGGNLYVDIPNLFRDFDADENDPANYDFAFTDRLLKAICDAGVEPFFRLGVTIENSYELKSYRIFAPTDPEKWARICEHVVRHYNEGWANGFHMGITYWEIWNEPEVYKDDRCGMWIGSKEQYFTLYEVTANHLKKCFGDSIRIGGYASTGFYRRGIDPNCDGNFVNLHYDANGILERFEYDVVYFHDFLKWITSDEHRAPIDFFSWHTYTDVRAAVVKSRYIRKVLSHYGLDHVEDILDEWNTTPDGYRPCERSTVGAAVRAAAMLLGMQKTDTSVLCYYDARLGPSVYGGMFNPDTRTPYLTYYPFLSFGTAYTLGREVFTEIDGETQDVYVLGATDGNCHILLLVNDGEEKEVTLDLQNADTKYARVTRLDEEYPYRYTGEALSDRIRLPKGSFVEILFPRGKKTV